MTPEEDIARIKVEHFERLKVAKRVWMIEEQGADFVVHEWSGPDHVHGCGVAPSSSYPTLRKAAARLMQLLAVGPVAPQTWPETVCIGSVDFDDAPPPL